MQLENFTIDAKKPVHVTWWAEHFDVSEETLLDAIAAVGERASDVNAYLFSRVLTVRPGGPILMVHDRQQEP